MRRQPARVLFLQASLLYLLGVSIAQAAGRSWGDYDRMLTTERFLVAVYPELLQERGLLTFQTQEFNLTPGWPLYVHLLRCHPGSGVPAGGQHPLRRPCPGPMQPDATNFLMVSVDSFSSRFPIFRFGAGGDFVDAKLRALRAEIRSHPEWDEKAMLEALRLARPQFGPDSREAFLKKVPKEVIYRFSGCRLDLKKASFGAFVSGELGMMWRVPGTSRVRGNKEICSATFEPFEGKLLTIG